MKKIKKINRTAAFTLVELMVVIVILGLLGSLVGVNVMKNIKKAKITTAKAQISMLHSAVNEFKLDTGYYPEQIEDLVEEPSGVDGWAEDGYLEGKSQIPPDPWKFEYMYEYPGVYSKFDIYSFGADGKEGGDDEDSDIYNSDVDGG